MGGGINFFFNFQIEAETKIFLHFGSGSTWF